MAFFLTAALVVAADQLAKVWIRSYPEGHLIYRLGIIRLTHVENTGSAFGLFQGQSFALTIVVAVGIGVLLVVALVVWRRRPTLVTGLHTVALGLVLGGALGNLIDRLRFGHVTDFIDIGVWPAFNVADSAVVIGAVIFAYSLLRSGFGEKARLA